MITELGDSYKHSKTFMNAIEFVQDTMDIGLSEWAIQNKIKLIGFETYEFHEELIASVMKDESKDYLENFSPYLINQYHHSPIQQIYESVEAW